MSTSSARLGVIIVAAGSGQRFGDEAKVLHPIGGKPMLAYSLELFASMPQVRQIVVVAGEHSIDRVQALVDNVSPLLGETCLGGQTRRESVQLGFGRISHRVEMVAVHDAARPLASAEMVLRLIEAAREAGAAVPVLPVTDTVYRLDDEGQVSACEERSLLRVAQTPQVARRQWLARALEESSDFTDEGGALLASGFPVVTVAGCAENIKITWPEDVQQAEHILARRVSR